MGGARTRAAAHPRPRTCAVVAAAPASVALALWYPGAYQPALCRTAAAAAAATAAHSVALLVVNRLVTEPQLAGVRGAVEEVLEGTVDDRVQRAKAAASEEAMRRRGPCRASCSIGTTVSCCFACISCARLKRVKRHQHAHFLYSEPRLSLLRFLGFDPEQTRADVERLLKEEPAESADAADTFGQSAGADSVPSARGDDAGAAAGSGSDDAQTETLRDSDVQEAGTGLFGSSADEVDPFAQASAASRRPLSRPRRRLRAPRALSRFRTLRSALCVHFVLADLVSSCCLADVLCNRTSLAAMRLCVVRCMRATLSWPWTRVCVAVAWYALLCVSRASCSVFCCCFMVVSLSPVADAFHIFIRPMRCLLPSAAVPSLLSAHNVRCETPVRRTSTCGYGNEHLTVCGLVEMLTCVCMCVVAAVRCHGAAPG